MASNVTEGSLEAAIAGFDTRIFSGLFFIFGFPMIACFALSLVLLYFTRFKLSLFRPWLVGMRFACCAACWTKARMFNIVSRLIAFVLGSLVIIVPILFLFLWGVYTAVLAPPASVGVFVICIGLALFTFTFGVLYWWTQQWRMQPLSMSAFVLTVLVICAFLIALLFLNPPHSYLGISFIFCAFNMLPMTLIVHMYADDGIADSEGNRRGITFKQLVENTTFEQDGTPKFKPIDAGHENTSRIFKFFLLYGSAIGILIAYMILVYKLTPGSEHNGVGFVTAGAIVLLDLGVLLYYKSGLLTNPTLLALTLLAVRAALVCWGARLFFMGHCTVVLITTLTLGYQLVNFLLPITDKEEEARNALDNPEKLLLRVHTAAQLAEKAAKQQAMVVDRHIRSLTASTPKAAIDTGAEEQPGPAPAEAEIEDTPSEDRVSVDDVEARVSSDVVLSDEPVEKARPSLRGSKMRWSFIMLIILTLVFVVDIIIVGVLKTPVVSDVVLPTGSRWDQYLFGLVTLLLCLVLPCAYLFLRFFRLNDYEVSFHAGLVAVLMEAFSLGAGIFLYFLSGAYTVLWLSLFLPIIYFTFTVPFCIWVQNDYWLLSHPSKRKGPHVTPAPAARAESPSPPGVSSPDSDTAPAPTSTAPAAQTLPTVQPQAAPSTAPPNAFKAFFRGWLPKQDYLVIICVIVCLGSIVAMGALIAETADPQPRWVGWTIALSFALLFATFLPLWKWFNTFEFDVFIAACAIFAIGILAGWCGGMLGRVYYVGTSYGLAIVFFTLMYPVIIFAATAIYQWRDDDWKLDPQFKQCFSRKSAPAKQTTTSTASAPATAQTDGDAASVPSDAAATAPGPAPKADDKQKREEERVKAEIEQQKCVHRRVVRSRFVVINLLLSATLIVAFNIALFVINWLAGLAVLVAVLMAGYLCVMLYVWVKNKFYLPKAWRISLVIVFFAMLGLGIGVGVVTTRPFYGFSATWCCFFIAAAVLGIRQEVRTFTDPTYRCQYSTYVIPVYKYVPERDDVQIDNRHVLFTYAALFISGSWGIVAAVFFTPIYIGLGVTALSIVFLIIYTTGKWRIPMDDLARALKYVNQSLLLSAMKQAFLKQVNKGMAHGDVVVMDVESQQEETREVDMFASKNRYLKLTKEYTKAFNTADMPPLHVVLLHIARKLKHPPIEISKWSFLLQQAPLNVDTTEKLVQLANVADLDELNVAQEVKDELRDIHAKHAKQERLLTEAEALSTLVQLDAEVARVHEENTRFRVHFQILALMACDYQRAREEALWQDMLRQMNIEIQDGAIQKWEPKKRQEFDEKFRLYMRKMRELNEQLERKREEERRAVLERERRLQEEEQRRIEEEERARLEELARREREEQERRRQEEEERLRREAEEAAERERQHQEELARIEAERRRLEEIAAEQKRLFEEQQRKQQEEEARKQAEEAERQRLEEEERKRKEIEQMRKQLEEERKRQREEEERRQREEAERIAREAEERLEAERKALAEAEYERQMKKLRSTKSAGESTVDTGELQAVLGRLGPGQSFHDPVFEHSHKSLGKVQVQLPPQVEWKSARAVYEKPELFIGGADPEDIRQGALGDCYFLSAISVMATRENMLESLFVDTSHADRGVYCVKFFKNGEWRAVVIDDFFPLDKHSQEPLFVHSNQRGELWMMVLEKAYAKLHGSYAAIENGNVAAAFVDMTAGAADEINMTKPNVQKDLYSGALWAKLISFKEKGYLLGAGTPAGSDTEISTMGIVQGHAYAVLDLREVDGHHLLRLRNPWGQTEWKGKWSDGWPGWTRRLKGKVDYVNADDGTFWIELDDFGVHFQNIYVCRLFGNMPHKTLVSAWNDKKGTAGGCLNNRDTFKNNPQFLLKVTRPALVFVLLRQEDTRGTLKKMLHIGFMVFDKKGKRVKTVFVGEMIGSSGDYMNSRERWWEAQLQPKQYTIVPTAFKAGDETNFSLICYCDDPDFEFTELDPALVPAV